MLEHHAPGFGLPALAAAKPDSVAIPLAASRDRGIDNTESRGSDSGNRQIVCGPSKATDATDATEASSVG